jgi:general secretion pathway protein G
MPPPRRQRDNALAARRRRRGLSRLQLAVAVIIIVVLIGIVLDRVNALMANVERANVTQVEGHIRAALGLLVATDAANGRLTAAAKLARSNPMDLLEAPPPNYVGARSGAKAARIRPGHWYFDTGTRRLVYRIEHDGAFGHYLPQPARLAFAIRRHYRDADHDGHFGPGDSLYGVRLERVNQAKRK